MSKQTIQIGDKFKRTFTSPFGKTITKVITVMSIQGRKVFMDDGQFYLFINGQIIG